MVVATRLSERVGGLPSSDAQRIREVIDSAGLPTRPPTLTMDRWLELMERDKKVAEGRIRYILLERLGSAVVRSDVSRDDLTAALAY
jgi:3-dehydroquinate synthase